MAITTAERKQRVSTLKEEHEDYFQTEGKVNALYIPKMAYRPSGKDELYVSFFPSELENEADIYTEFVSIDYESEDPKRTLYLSPHNPHWKAEYEIVTSKSGFVRHFIPVSELKIINDVTSRNLKSGNITTKMVDKEISSSIFELTDPDISSGYITEKSLVVNKLEEINQTLITLGKIINKFNK
jgi:hypothetical protein